MRRDRIRLTVWTLSIAAFTLYFAFALTTIFDEAALRARAAVMETPSGIVMGGPGYGLDDYTPAVAMANEGITWIVLALAIMSILHVVRHTRLEEETGRSELVLASAVGRRAPGVAAMLTLGAHLLVTAAVATGAMLLGAPDAPLADTAAMMLGCALSAFVFGAVALVTSQITSHARTAIGLALAVFGLAFVVRAAGDLQERGGSALSWLSPIAWAQQLRAFVDVRWWPLLLSLAAVVALLVVAALLSGRRDIGAGLVATRPGRRDARTTLRSPMALAWLQQRGALLWSTLGLGLLWFASGTMMSTLDDMVSDLVETNPIIGQLFGTDPSEFTTSFLGVMMLYISLCAAAYAIVAGQRPKGEETAGRLELPLAAPVSRARWLGGQLTVAGLGTLVLLAASVYGLWAGAALVGVDDPGLGDYTAVFVSYTPAVLVFLGLTAALYGWAPRATGLAWLLLAFVFIAGMFGALFELPEWVLGISPFHWVPESFGDGVDGAGLAGLTAVAAALFLVGIVGFRRRDALSG
ncbi:exporter of polyketide antibiotics [Microbacterium album]|uniref:Exporter of polyketide antibiotics n=1 Tax=Microbacterium album TaxID=2053191 RepID=A0A917IES8_9MICO|nr:exporter of polyketide antibiotics [Microbacterium album]